MSVISGLGGGASQAAWAEIRAGSSGQSRRAQEMFARADVDGSGSVNASELQTVLDKFSERSGRSLGSAESQFSTLDSDGDGALSSSETESLRSQFSSALDQALSGTGSSSSSSSSSDSSGASGSGSGSASSALDQLAGLLLRRYGGVAEGGWQSRPSLSLSA